MTMDPRSEAAQQPNATVVPVTGGDWAPVRLDLLGLLAKILVQWRTIASIAALFLVASSVFAKLSKNYYESFATFMPPAREAGPFGLSGGFSPGSVLAIGGLGINPGTAYLSLLYSRSVQDSVAQQLNVQSVYHLKDSQAARDFVANKTKFDVQPTGLIVVISRDESPQFAAKLANAYLEALYKLNQRMSAASIAQRSEFYGQEVAQAREALEKAEATLIATQQRIGILEPGSTTQVAISTEARLEASIQGAEVQLAILRQSQTDSSPEVVRQMSQIAQLRAQLAQQRAAVSGTNLRAETGKGSLPQQSLESVRSGREVREREAIYETLLRQSDATRLSETDPGPLLQVVDTAIVPLRKAGPNRKYIVVMATLFGLVVGILYAATRHFFVQTYTRLRDRMRVVEGA